MFLAAVAQPRFDPDRDSKFNGLIGIWPFAVEQEAQRNSKNRPKGTMVTKPVESVGREDITEMLTTKVIPAIREKLPSLMKGEKISIQQDNARPHCQVNDTRVNEEGQKEGWDITLTCQPPNSPDLNVLDLGFFNSIQSIQYQESPANVDELIKSVVNAFWSEPVETTENVFLTLQKVMELVMIEKGDNKYKMPHMKKSQIRRTEENMPLTISCSDEAFQNAMDVLK